MVITIELSVGIISHEDGCIKQRSENNIIISSPLVETELSPPMAASLSSQISSKSSIIVERDRVLLQQ